MPTTLPSIHTRYPEYLDKETMDALFLYFSIPENIKDSILDNTSSWVILVLCKRKTNS